MAYTFVSCQGFESRHRSIFSIAGTGSEAIFSRNTPGPWSEYSINANNGNVEWPIGVPTPINNVWINFNMSIGGSYASHIRFKDNSGIYHFSLGRNGSGLLQLYRGSGSTLLGTGVTVCPNDMWQSVEIFFNCDDSNGRLILYLNGNLEINYTGDTNNGGNVGLFGIGVSDTGNDWYWDDFVIGTGTESDRQGPLKVKGLAPKGDGAVMQLNKTPSSVSRFYMPSDDTDSNTPNTVGGSERNNHNLSITPDASWEHTYSFLPRRLMPALGSWTVERKNNFGFNGISADDDLLMFQFVSPPIAAQTISGTVKGQMRVKETDAAYNERAQVVIRVVSNNGSTVRGTLLAPDTGALSSEWNSISHLNRQFPRGGAQALTNVNAQEGDRIVIELGTRHHGSGTTSSPDFIIEASSSTDLPEDESSGGSFNSWIEFSNPITMSSTFGNWEYVTNVAPSANISIAGPDVNDYDFYLMDDLESTFDTVLGATLRSVARRSDSGAANLSLGVRQGASESFGSDIGLAIENLQIQERHFPVDPTDSAAWTRNKINSLQIGWKVR